MWLFLKFCQFSSVQSLSRVRLFVTRQASLSITSSGSSLRLTSIESVMPSNHLILCRPLLLLPSIFSSISGNESVICIRWPKYWNFSFIICPFKKYSGLFPCGLTVCFPAVQGTLKSLLQHHSSKASILWLLVFFMARISHPYMTTWKKYSFDY